MQTRRAISTAVLCSLSAINASAGTNTWSWNPVAGVSVNQVLASPHYVEQAFAATYGASMLRTDDGGASWTNVSPHDPDGQCIALSPGQPETIFLGTEGSGVFRTTDGGGTWERKSEGLRRSYILSLVADPESSERLYVGVQGAGAYRLSSWSDPWRNLSESWMRQESLFELDLDASNDRLMALGRTAGLMVGAVGAGWNERSSPGQPIRALATHPRTDGTLLIGGDGAFVSFDEGLRWTNVSGGLGGQTVYCLAADTGDTNRFYAGTLGEVAVFDSDDLIWQRFPCGDPRHIVNTLSVSPIDPSIIWAGVEGDGVYRSTDSGETWDLRSTGLPNVACVSMVVDPDDDRIALAGAYHGGVYRTIDAGHTWELLPSPANHWRIVRDLALDPMNPTIVYAAVMPDGLWRSVEGDTSWTRLFPSDPKPEFRDACTAVLLDVTDPDRVLVGTYGNGVFRSVDGALNWSYVGLDGESIWALEQDPFDPNHLLAGSYHGVHSSVDGGWNWTTTSGDFSIRCIAFDQEVPGAVFATTRSDGVLLSSDGGKSWSQDPSTIDDLENLWGVAVVRTRMDRRILVVGTYRNGMAHRELDPELDSGWIWWNEGLEADLSRELAIGSLQNGRIYVAFDGGGVGSILPSELPLPIDGEIVDPPTY
ncbi:MAG: hypothetical protein CME06_04580 [Gemmatimonadetes bacterium]|nr:hypothetical protein [Gemmatimonadota bacterium]